MAQLEGVNVEKLQGGLGRSNPNTDSHFGMILTLMTASALHTDVNNNGKGVVINSVFDAENLGFNESFDDNEDLNYYDQIVEFFRLAPNGTLYLLSSDDTDDIQAFLNANKDIKGYGIDFDQSQDDLKEADLNTHQALINAMAADNRLIDFAMICVSDGSLPTIDLFDQECPNVSVSLACEKDDKKTSWGSVLGMLAVRTISENLGSVDIEHKPLAKRGTNDYPLTDAVLDRWPTAYLNDGTSVSMLSNSALQNDLMDKGYIVAASYEGYPGFFLENSYTAVERSSDFAFIENNRVWNKAARIVRQTLLPRVKSKVKKDPSTGYIASTTTSYWQTLCEKAVQQMVNDDDASGFEVSIDHKQIVNSTDPVKVKLMVVANGIVHEFEVAVGLTNKVES